MKKIQFIKRVLFPAAAAVFGAGIVTAVFFLHRAGSAPERAMLRMEDGVYIDPYQPLSELPFNYRQAGVLTKEQANGTGLAGCTYYVNRFDEDGIYVYQRVGAHGGTCTETGMADAGEKAGSEGAPDKGTGTNSITNVMADRENAGLWAYKRWVRVDEKKLAQRRLTLEDVIRLAKKGDALEEKDFDDYSYFETSVDGMRVYEIDGTFSVWLTGARGWRSEPGALRIYLRGRDAWEWEDLLDIRTGDVEEFIREHQETAAAWETAERGTVYFPYPDEGIGNDTCIGDYWYQGSHFSVYDTGIGSFSPSLASSHLGIGTYEVTGERMFFQTYDGWYTYYFDIEGDTLILDGEASVWGNPSRLVDGAVLE